MKQGEEQRFGQARLPEKRGVMALGNRAAGPQLPFRATASRSMATRRFFRGGSKPRRIGTYGGGGEPHQTIETDHEMAQVAMFCGRPVRMVGDLPR